MPFNINDGSKNFFNRYFKLIQISIFLLIVVLGISFIIVPSYFDDFGENGKLNADALTKELNQKSDYLGKIKQLQADYVKSQSQDQGKINFVMPQEKEIPAILTQMESLATRNGLVVNAVDVAQNPEDAKKNKYETLYVTLKLSGGNYTALKKFIGDLETNVRIFDLNAINYDPKGLFYNLTLRTYYLPTSKAATK